MDLKIKNSITNVDSKCRKLTLGVCVLSRDQNNQSLSTRRVTVNMIIL